MKTTSVPSGRVFGERVLNLVKELGRIGFITWEKDVVRVHGREELTEQALVLGALGHHIALEIMHSPTLTLERGGRARCLIGIPTTGTTLALATTLGAPWNSHFGFRVMKETKRVGTNQTWVDGISDPGRHQYLSIDTTISLGRSFALAIQRLRHDAYPVEDMTHLILVDEHNGEVEDLRNEQLKVLTIFNLLDLVHLFGVLGVWPKLQVRAAEAEIAERTKR